MPDPILILTPDQLQYAYDLAVMELEACEENRRDAEFNDPASLVEAEEAEKAAAELQNALIAAIRGQ